MRVPTLLHAFARPTKEASDFLTIVGGQGAEVWDRAGRRYIDAMASLWYCNAGHGERRIIDAISAQLGALATYNIFDPFTNEPADALADRIASLTPVPDARVFFTSSGSEAIDTALKLARLTQTLSGSPDKVVIVSREQGYHGTAYGGTSAQGIGVNRQGWGELLTGFVHVAANDVESAARVFAERGSEIAAVVAEPVQGAGGVHPAAPGFLTGLRRLCDDHGALLILDEVITDGAASATGSGASTTRSCPIWSRSQRASLRVTSRSVA